MEKPPDSGQRSNRDALVRRPEIKIGLIDFVGRDLMRRIEWSVGADFVQHFQNQRGCRLAFVSGRVPALRVINCPS